MKYDLSIKLDLEKCKKRLNDLALKGAFVEVTDKTKRSTKQNAYLHVLLTALALELGYNLETIKVQIYKQAANKDLFLRERKGRLGIKKYWRSSAELDNEEMTNSIKSLKEFASKHGIVLPEPTDEQGIRSIKKEYDKYKHLID